MLWPVLSTTALAVVLGMSWFRPKTKLTGRHVIITGGSEGLGYCLAKDFVRKGCRVTIIARTQSKLDRAVTGLQSLPSPSGVQVQAISADVTDFQQACACNIKHASTVHSVLTETTLVIVQIQSAVQGAEAKFGPCDMLISNAGITQPGKTPSVRHADKLTQVIKLLQTLWPCTCLLS